MRCNLERLKRKDLKMRCGCEDVKLLVHFVVYDFSAASRIEDRMECRFGLGSRMLQAQTLCSLVLSGW